VAPGLPTGASRLGRLRQAPGPEQDPGRREVCALPTRRWKAAVATADGTTRHENEKSKETVLCKDREKHCNTVPVGRGLATAPPQTHPSRSLQKFRATEQIISSLIALSSALPLPSPQPAQDAKAVLGSCSARAAPSSGASTRSGRTREGQPPRGDAGKPVLSLALMELCRSTLVFCLHQNKAH